MCGIFVTPCNQSCKLTWKNVKAELHAMKIDIQLYEPRTVIEYMSETGNTTLKEHVSYVIE